MSWFSRDKRNKVPAAEIAASIFQAFVEGDEAMAEKWGVPPEFATRFRDESRLYREALVLLVLGTQTGKEEVYEKVLNEYEKIILPSQSTAAGLRRIEELRFAMNELDRLLQPEQKRQSSTWAGDWFKRLGCEQYNPAVLMWCANWWMTTHVEVSRVVNESLRPS